mgnify:CR=1 FL=1
MLRYTLYTNYKRMVKRIVGVKPESIFANGKEADYEIV